MIQAIEFIFGNNENLGLNQKETDDESDSEAEERPACNDRKRLPKKTKKTKTTIQCEKKMKKNDDSDEDKLEESGKFFLKNKLLKKFINLLN